MLDIWFAMFGPTFRLILFVIALAILVIWTYKAVYWFFGRLEARGKKNDNFGYLMDYAKADIEATRAFYQFYHPREKDVFDDVEEARHDFE